MRHKLFSFFILFITGAAFTAASAQTWNINDFGAAGDGETLNTRAIQAAVDTCSALGGTVYFPAGRYLSGSIELKDNVSLHFERGAVLLGSTDIKDYTSYINDLKSYNDAFLEYSLLYAHKKENISLTGFGVIDGQGESFQATTKKKPDRYMNRPFVIRFVETNNIVVEDLTLQNSAMWMQQYLACEDLRISGIRVYNHCNKNNDMMDIDGCRNVIISDCIGDTDDDALTIKSTSLHPTENVTITNCVISSHCNAIKMGTESHSGFKNITISNCVVKPSKDTDPIYGYPEGISGITLGLVDGGTMDGVMISNIRIDGPMVPIYMRLGNRARRHTPDAPKPGVGSCKNVSIDNVIATGASTIGCSITGIPGHPVENIRLSNISLSFSGGVEQYDILHKLPELEEHYPESTKWGDLPAYGFYIRHAEDVVLDNVGLKVESRDVRPALFAEDVEGLRLESLELESSGSELASILLRSISGGMVSFCRSTAPDLPLIWLDEANKDIFVISNINTGEIASGPGAAAVQTGRKVK